ncbi:kinesin-like protein KIN-UC isoform X2 [Ricinus communis]|uniref:kinesin-like protein KIN-UC isoform X2 n=1 Tax=Ricinus communis TaxID=3988 RepID=UPI000D688799|nr:kinesin-like protein KIN-UC isoform X2 [Ricinus communis]|eukprot:XP_025014956.1 kinesin-like protein KIN-UC isoform X2 [Ricinus communis]
MKQQMASSNSSTLRTSSSSSLSSSRNVNEVSNYAHRSSYIKAAAAAAAPSSRRSVTPTSRSHSSLRQNDDNDSGRVRVAVRLRPRNAEDLISDADSFDCVELQPEMRRLKLRKNNWSSESYRFDDIFTESASQKRVYEAVAKPVVESVLNGYNGTVMAYGQTGTGKTYTVGRLGKNDASERGIVVRALEDVIANTSPDTDVVEMSYLQLYMESIQDLLAPEKINIPINEDPRTGEVSLPGATIVRVRDLDNLFELLQIGEMNRHAANTKQNTESSRSHAILMVYVRRSIHQKLEDETTSQDSKSDLPSSNGIPRVRKGKLLIVDLAGSERLDKSGSEGHLLEEAKFINLSLTSLGKCINALAENSPHIPTRDSKLTRLLRDSFGGSARTSLIITIGPSSRHHAETTSTIMFGQRAMKIVNMVKLKEEFDYESLSRKLGTQLDHLTAEIERELKLRDIEKRHLEKQLNECQDSFAQTKKHLVARSEFLEQENARLELEMKEMLNELDHRTGENGLMHDKVQLLELRLKESQQHQLENSTYQKVLADTTQMYERKIAEINKKFEDEHACYVRTDEELYVMKQLLSDCQKSNKQHEMENSAYQKALTNTTEMYEKNIAELNKQLQDEHALNERVEERLDMTKKLLMECQNSIKQLEVENSMYLKVLEETRQLYEKKTAELSKQLEDEHARFEGLEEQLDQANKLLSDGQDSIEDLEEIEELKGKLQEMYQLHDNTINELQSLKSDKKDLLQEKTTLIEELCDLKRRLLVEEKQRKSLEHELAKLKKSAPESDSAFEDKQSYTKENISKSYKSNPSRETLSSQRVTIAKICEEVGLQKILQLLASEDSDVQIHAVKVIANLAAEEINQEKIVEEGGLDALLMLLKSSQNATILRVASGAIANLAMNEMNQGLIMSKGGAQLLAKTASKTDDPQTLRMVAGALANLCGNVSLHMMLKEDGAIKALLEMAKSKSIDVIAQVARGMANFAKCESRGTLQGQRKGRSLLIEDDALEWLIANSNSTSSSTRRHVELALCHLAQNEDNVKDFISSGGTKELVRISVESSREDIRNLAKKTLKLSPSFETEAKELIILERCSS